MKYRKNMLFICALGVFAIVGLVLHNHIVSVKAAKLSHVVPPAPYFPPGAPWLPGREQCARRSAFV